MSDAKVGLLGYPTSHVHVPDEFLCIKVPLQLMKVNNVIVVVCKPNLGDDSNRVEKIEVEIIYQQI